MLIEESNFLTPTLGFALSAVVMYLLAVFAVFWVIRLAVRYGMNDALRMNRAWLQRDAQATRRDQ